MNMKSHDALPIVDPVRQLSWQAQIFNVSTKILFKPVLEIAPVTPATMYTLRLLYGTAGLVTRRLPRFVTCEPTRFAHVEAEWIRAGTNLDNSKVILYLHGGGYFFGSMQAHRPMTWRMSHATKRPILSINYRLAPKANLADSRDDALMVYRQLLKHYKPEDIVIYGESAGGHLTLVTLHAIREEGLPFPAAAMCLSPWTDLMCLHPSHRLNRDRDTMFSARALNALGKFYRKKLAGAHQTIVAPLDEDFSGFPPLLITVGEREVLRDDALKLAERAHNHGVNVSYESWSDMPHAFQVFSYILPEARLSFQRMATFLTAVEAIPS